MDKLLGLACLGIFLWWVLHRENTRIIQQRKKLAEELEKEIKAVEAKMDESQKQYERQVLDLALNAPREEQAEYLNRLYAEEIYGGQDDGA